jgi:hypothetical protein
LGTGIGTDTGALAVLSLGLVCVGGGCRGRVKDATTDGAGHYVFTLKGRDTQGSFGEAVSVLVAVTGAPGRGQVSGPLTAARFRVQVANVRLPPLDLVDPGLEVDGDQVVGARWTTSKPGPYTVSFELAKDVPVWRTVAAQAPVAVDPRLLEDTSGRVVVSSTSDEAIEGSDVTLTWRSPGVAYVGGMGAPPSRGRPCRFMDAAGASTPPEPCGLTDGDLTTSAAPAPSVCPSGASTVATPSSTTQCGRAAWAVVDLGHPVPVELVAVRGCGKGCAVEVSGDGRTYRPAGTAADGFGAIALDGSPVTSVRTSVAELGNELREVSVWGPRPSRPALLSIAASDRSRLGRPFSPESHDRGQRRWLLVLAASLAGIVLLGAGFVLGRRRSSGPRLAA